ncbi:JmjC domain-containing hydroxylase [Ciceribacter lividus]|uniref:JmjC domain-containing hydroxylase n=2 Tax=Ciceribacter lividus TaxID=1197950 RepID=A0A6I7HK74_9HYPH|nr:JmjC domain-containing hydroxylase [Ciceribacter lividus]
MLPYRSASDFFCEFGDAHVDVTDGRGCTVRRSQLYALATWWQNRSAAPAEEALSGTVVHWPIREDDNHSARLQGVIDDVTRYIVDGHADRSSIFDLYDFPQIPRFAWAIIGPKSVPVNAHQDMFGTASWNLLYSGRKEWSFWAPDLHAIGGHPPFTTFEQCPGELVWIPENWWHSVRYRDASICFSKNLILRRSVDSVLQSMRLKAPRYAHVLEAVLLTEQRSKVDVA